MKITMYIDFEDGTKETALAIDTKTTMLLQTMEAKEIIDWPMVNRPRTFQHSPAKKVERIESARRAVIEVVMKTTAMFLADCFMARDTIDGYKKYEGVKHG